MNIELCSYSSNLFIYVNSIISTLLQLMPRHLELIYGQFSGHTAIRANKKVVYLFVNLQVCSPLPF